MHAKNNKKVVREFYEVIFQKHDLNAVSRYMHENYIQHCPLNFKRIDKLVFFQAACMQGMFGGIYDGKELYYNGPGNCIYDDNKIR